MKKLLIALAIFNAPMAFGAAAPAAPGAPVAAAAAGYPATTPAKFELDRLRVDFGMGPWQVNNFLSHLASVINHPENNMLNPRTSASNLLNGVILTLLYSRLTPSQANEIRQLIKQMNDNDESNDSRHRKLEDLNGKIRAIIRMEGTNDPDKFFEEHLKVEYGDLLSQAEKLKMEPEQTPESLLAQWKKIATQPLFDLYNALYDQAKIELPAVFEMGTFHLNTPEQIKEEILNPRL